ncbi:AMP-binding protein [Aquibium sp. LZ166]|uniref:AMP-binding protein n=1 Tax=Aquibium pacificus TaxID=3153579 RepID=A0ABV3SKI9_9HYPH
MSLLDQPPLIFPDVIAHNARSHGAKTAVVCGQDRLSWAAFNRRTNMVANALIRAGLRKGDKVCLFMFNSIPMFELLWGTVKAGGVIAPLNVMMAKDALPAMINNSEARFLFADATTYAQIDAIRSELPGIRPDGFHCAGHSDTSWGSYADFVEGQPETEPEIDIALSDSMSIIYSSGTTGVPKGIEHSHLARHMYSLGAGPAFGVDRYATVVCSTPLYTNGTWINMLPAVYFGGTVVLLSKFSGRDFIETVEREGGTHAFLVPTQMIVILAEQTGPGSMKTMRGILSGGAPLTTTTFNEMRERFPHIGIYEIYGITEGFIAVAEPRDWERGKRGSVGKPLFGADVQIIDHQGNVLERGQTGEIVGWSAGLMKGYYRDPRRTEDMIWRGPRNRTYLKSGDVGRLDEEGFIYVSGRVKDMIISGGINVFASDIEEVFMQHPEVKEVAAIGIPHDKWGETPLLLAIMHPGARITEEELAAWGNERLGKFQRVGRCEFRTEFPRATHDKVLKRALRDPYWEGRERSI